MFKSFKKKSISSKTHFVLIKDQITEIIRYLQIGNERKKIPEEHLDEQTGIKNIIKVRPSALPVT